MSTEPKYLLKFFFDVCKDTVNFVADIAAQFTKLGMSPSNLSPAKPLFIHIMFGFNFLLRV
jgi:hypothetical protein